MSPRKTDRWHEAHEKMLHIMSLQGEANKTIRRYHTIGKATISKGHKGYNSIYVTLQSGNNLEMEQASGTGLRTGERWERGGGCGYERSTRGREVMGLSRVLTAGMETRTHTYDTACLCV